MSCMACIAHHHHDILGAAHGRWTYRSNIGSFIRSTTSPRTYVAFLVCTRSDTARTYSQEVKCPRRYHGKVDERAEAATDGDKQDGDSRLQAHRVHRCSEPLVEPAKGCR